MPSSSDLPVIRIHVFVSGRVQRVGYRYHTIQEATRLNLAGWVKNLPDGRVEAVFEGEKAVVEQMIQWCHKGPEAASPTHVEVHSEPPQGLKGFELQWE